MKKKWLLVLVLLVVKEIFASDAITLDSMFKSQQGLRTITTVESLSSGNANSFSTYPGLTAVNEGKYWQDVKTLSLQQTFLYDITNNLDLIVAAIGSHKRREFYNIISLYGHEDSTDLDAIWIGASYTFNAVGIFVPNLTMQASLYQKERYLDVTSNESMKSYAVKGSLKNYSDPLISTVYLTYGLNQGKQIGDYNVENGDTYGVGFNFAVILNPKIALDLGAEQRYQTETKIDGVKYSNSLVLSTMSMGLTYTFDSLTSASISSSMGGSSASPDSIMSVSLWKKF